MNTLVGQLIEGENREWVLSYAGVSPWLNIQLSSKQCEKQCVSPSLQCVMDGVIDFGELGLFVHQ